MEGKKSRSAMSFENALLQLLNNYEYDDITVDQIIKESGYSRTAFYSNYKNKECCLKQIIDRECETYVKCITRSISAVDSEKDYEFDSYQYQVYYEFFTHIYTEKALYLLFLNNPLLSEWYTYFRFKVIDELNNCLLVYDTDSAIKIDQKMFINYTATGFLAGIDYWIINGFEYSPEYMARQYCFFSRVSLKMITISDSH